MSHGYNATGASSEYDAGANENPYAVWIRNVPTWFDEDRFYKEISKWYDIDKNNSYVFKNKYDASWKGVKYGWAIVSFKSKKSRNNFLDSEDWHFVKENDSSPYEKLKVSPWFDKPNKKAAKEKQVVKLPFYKSDLEKELRDPNPNNLTYEEFSRNSSDTSIHSFRGTIKSYITDSEGQGFVGDLEVKVHNSKSGTGTELVIFHSDCVWLCGTHSNCSGTSDCAVKCGKEKSLPSKLKVGAEVRFTSRRIPHGIVNGRRYQAKAVWLNQESYPKFISPPPTSKLDEYLEDYLRESGQELKSKSSSPEPYNNGKISLQGGATGTHSPSLSVPVRQKPLKGGLNQLNSNPSKNAPLPTQRKAPPTNFAQAVAPTTLAVKDEQSNLILAVANVESILSETEALIFIPEYGNYTLNIKQIDFGFKPNQGINKYLTAKQSTVSVTLKKNKVGGKIKHDIVRADLIDEKKALDEKFDPFFKDFKTKTYTNTTKNFNENVEARIKNGNDIINEACDNTEIDLDELDEYYDDLQRIIDYLERELPKVIPTIANEKGIIQKLSNEILSNPDHDEAAELQLFLDKQQIPPRIKHIFIAEFLKFRSQSDSEEGSPRSSPASSPQQDPEVESTLKLFFAWLKKREKKNDVFWAKLDLYSFVLRNFPVLATEWLKVITNETETHFQPFIKRTVLGEEEFNKLKTTTTKYLKDNEKLVVQDFTTLTTWLETDTNSYRSLVTKSSDGFESGYLGLSLSKFEKEFYDHQHNKAAATKNVIPIIRAILFLRYSEIKFEGLNKLHQRCPDDEMRNTEFTQKIQNLLYKWANQRLLDDVNLHLSRETFGASDEDYPNMRLEKYVTVLSQSLCDFFADKLEQKKAAFEEKMIKKAAALENGDKRKAVKAGNTVATSKHFIQADYLGFSHYLELSIASGRVTLAPTANVESIIWTFQARNVAFSKLADIYAKSQKMGGLSWQLQMSQLKLNPPLGVTVPEIAEYLASYFASVNNSATAEALDEELPESNEVMEDEVEIVAEEDLLTMIQKSLVEQYKDPEVVSFVKELKKGSIKVREGELIGSYEDMFSGHQLFSKTCWGLADDQLCPPSVCALITAGIWHDLNVSSDFLSMCVRNIHDNQMTYQGVLIKWAKMLENSGVFSCSVLDIFTIIKATLLVYDESVPEQEFLNISTNYCLYNVEGYVSSHLSESMFAVQTQFSLVICHLGVTYCQCCHDLSYPLPSDHWKQCSLETCVPLGTRLQLHSTGIKDPRGKIICQIADIVWSSASPDVAGAGSRSDPPETGVLLPGNVNYKKYVQYFAEKMAARSNPVMFSDNNYTTNNARYLELDAMYGNHQEIFLMAETWAHKNIMEMRKEFVFCEMGGMTSPLLRSNWAGALNTSDQEKERLLNETFDFFQNDQETSEMVDFIKPYVEKAGLRNAMKVLNQKYLEKEEEAASINDTDSEKRKSMNCDTETGKDDGATSSRPAAGFGGRNRQLSTDTIKDEALWLAENNLEQLWAEETEQEKSKRLEDLAEVNDDSEEYIEDDENPDKETKQLGAIGSSKPRTGRDSLSPHGGAGDNVDNGLSTVTHSMDERLDKLAKFELAMSAWQPMASDFISGNRDLIVQLSSRIEYLETALNQLTLNLASGGHVNNANNSATNSDEAGKNDVRKGSRTYVKIAKEGDEDDIAEVPTNSDGMLPELTVTALYGGTSAIKYKVADGKTWRALLLENDVYHPPEDGWGDRVYTCTQPQLTSKSPAKPDLGQETSGVSSGPEPGHRPSLPGYSLGPTMGTNNNLVSPFLGMPPMAGIWGSGGLNLASQVSPAQQQSIFNNIGPLGNIGPSFSGPGPNLGPHFSKNN